MGPTRTGRRNTTVKILGGIGLAASVSLGAAACGSSHSSFHVESHAGDPNKIHTVAQFKSEQYWSVQNQVVVQAMQNNSLMALAADVPSDEGAVTDALLADTHESDLISDVVTKIANGCRTGNLSNVDYSNYLNGPTGGTCPSQPSATASAPAVPTPAPQAAPTTTPAPSSPQSSAASQSPQSALNELVAGLGSTYATSGVIAQNGTQWVAVSTNTTSAPTTVGVSIYKFANGSFVRQSIVRLTDAGAVMPAAQDSTPITTTQVTPASDPDFVVTTAAASTNVTSVISDATGTWAAVPFDVNGQQEDSVPLATISGNTIHTQFNNCVPNCANGTETDEYFTYSNGVFTASNPAANTAEPLTGNTTLGASGKLYDVTAATNLRSGPNTAASVMTTVPAGTMVGVQCKTTGEAVNGPWGTDSHWDRVVVNGAKGYLTDEFVDTKSDETNDALIPNC
jgi:hypothetical protein